MNEMTTHQQCEALAAHGYYVGMRDSRRNTDHAGRYMVCEDSTVGGTRDASVGGFCIVGDNYAALVHEAYDHVLSMESAP